MRLRLLVGLVLLGGCPPPVEYGTLTPHRNICTLGPLSQELALANDFQLVTIGDPPGFVSSDDFKRTFAQEAADVPRAGACAGKKPVGKLRYELHRVELGSTRSLPGKILAWVGLIPTIGFSSIYPFSEMEWLTIELDSKITLGDKEVWRAQTTRHVELRTIGEKQFFPFATYLSEAIEYAQKRALNDLSPLLGEEND